MDSLVLDQLNRLGAFIQGSHVVYASGKHGSQYINKDAIYPHTGLLSALCKELALKAMPGGPWDAVAAPVIGGVVLSQWTAHHLSVMQGREVLAIYAEKAGEGFEFRRGYDSLLGGLKILVVEDVLNTGGSAKKVVDTVRSAGGVVGGVAALFNRGGITAQDLGEVPALFSLYEIRLEAFEEALCPFCRARIPINTAVGKGKEFLARKSN